MLPAVVFGHSREGPRPAHLGEQGVELLRWLMAENIGINREAADVREAEQQAGAAFENEVQPVRRERIQQGEGVNGLLSATWDRSRRVPPAGGSAIRR